MRQPLFDHIVIADWSARSRPSPKRPSKDAIWIGHTRSGRCGLQNAPPIYCRTRFAGIETVAEILRRALRDGRRVLVGFDFPFGYPVGVAERLTGTPSALLLWDWLCTNLRDGPDNSHSAFEAGALINSHWPGPGPCWGHPQGRVYEGLSPLKRGIRFGSPDTPPEKRLIEQRVTSAKSVWQLAYAGSVGAQALTGIAALARLRAEFGPALSVWPIETGLCVPDTPLVLAEIYPSLYAAEVRAAREPGEILDRAQVRVTAHALAELDGNSTLAPLFGKPPGLTEREHATVAREEAWMLGVP